MIEIKTAVFRPPEFFLSENVFLIDIGGKSRRPPQGSIYKVREQTVVPEKGKM
jgi:hypothetical protein